MASGAPATPSLLPGQSPPLFTITSSDQAGTIVVVAGVCLVTAVVSVLIRAYILVQLSGTRINLDDWAIAVALLFAIIQSSLVQEEAHTGLGRTIREITSHEARKIQQTQLADQIFYIIAVWVSKVSVALFFPSPFAPAQQSPHRQRDHSSHRGVRDRGYSCEQPCLRFVPTMAVFHSQRGDVHRTSKSICLARNRASADS